jgi:hypothetical protein
VSNGFGVIIEMLVAILLALTIGYCMMLNRRLKLLRSDEQSLRQRFRSLSPQPRSPSVPLPA